jgi:hypothetical protein
VVTTDEPALHRRTAPAPESRTRDVVALAIVACALLLPLRGLLRLPGPPMEEGFMLTFPWRVLQGDVPNRDFLHLYGPGSLWALAGVYKVFGATLEVQRLFGLLQQAGVAFGTFFIARWWGRRLAVVCALSAVAIMLPPAGLTAFAWTGAVGSALCGAAVALHARALPDDARHARRGTVLALVAGTLFGLAFLFRLDLVVAIGLAGLVLVWGMPRRRALTLVAATVGVSALVLVQFVLAGFADAFRGMVLQPVFDLRGGRHLPVPPSWGQLDGYLQRIGGTARLLPWPLPTLAASHELFLWFVLNLACIAALVVVGVVAVRRDATSIRARAVLVGGALSLGMLSQTLQRPDSTHIAWVSCVSIGLVATAVVEGWRSPERGPRTFVGRHARLVACAVPIVIVGLIIPNFTVRTYADFVAQTFGRHRSSYLIERNGVRFYYGDPTVAAAATAMLPTLDRLVHPGTRLFVGPADLSRTVTSEAWIYALYPEAVPGTFYIEMDPGIANAQGSRLASDLASSDVVVLSRNWADWSEANDSVKPGSGAAGRVLARDFCPVATFDPWFEVYRRCRH